MRYSLAQLIRLALPKGSRKRVFAIPAVHLPLYCEDQLAVLLVRLLRARDSAYRAHVIPRYTLPVQDGVVRDDQPDLEAAIAEAEAEVARLLLVITPQVNDWLVRAERLHAGQFARNVKTASGVDLTTTVGLGPAQETMAGVLARLNNLVTGLNDDARKAMAEVVWRGFTQRTPRTKMARELRDALEISRRRALLIASDQTTKLSAVLDQERQTEAGIDRYRWRHSRKARPRREHVSRDGLLFWWKKPPYDGHPGFAIHCGCKPEAYVDLDAL